MKRAFVTLMCAGLAMASLSVFGCAQPTTEPPAPAPIPVTVTSYSEIPSGVWKTFDKMIQVQDVNGPVYDVSVYKVQVLNGTESAKNGLLYDYSGLVQTKVTNYQNSYTGDEIWNMLKNTFAASDPLYGADEQISPGAPYTIMCTVNSTSSLFTGATVVVEGSKLTVTVGDTVTIYTK